jgi:hypothetical protein
MEVFPEREKPAVRNRRCTPRSAGPAAEPVVRQVPQSSVVLGGINLGPGRANGRRCVLCASSSWIRRPKDNSAGDVFPASSSEIVIVPLGPSAIP